MFKKYFFIALGILTITSCDKSIEKNVDQVQLTPKTSASAITVDESGYQFGLEWPAALTKQGKKPAVKYNETSGVLEIVSGEDIQIEVTDDAIGLDEIKKELQDNQMFSYKFYDETPQGFIFQAILPDGTSYFYNFLVQKNIGGKTYLFKSRDNEEFTLNDVKTMMEIAISAK